MNTVIQPLKNLLNKSGISYEEVLAFSEGMQNLTMDEQILLYRVLNHDMTMLYPHYVHFKAKLANEKNNVEWEKAVTNEIKFLESKLNKKTVGGEVK